MKEIITSALFISVALGCGSAAADNRVTKNGWDYTSIEDPFEDKYRYIVSKVIDRDNGVVVKCDRQGEDSLYIGFLTNNYIGSSGDRHNGKVRVDKNEVIEANISADGSIGYIFDRKITEKIIVQFLSGESVAFRSVTFNYEHADASVSLSGANEAIRWVNENCKSKMLP